MAAHQMLIFVVIFGSMYTYVLTSHLINKRNPSVSANDRERHSGSLSSSKSEYMNDMNKQDLEKHEIGGTTGIRNLNIHDMQQANSNVTLVAFTAELTCEGNVVGG